MLSDNIKFYRQVNDMTQSDLGKLIGVTKQTIQKYEKGEIINVPYENVVKMANIFNISAVELMGINGKYNVDDVYTNIMHKLKALTPEQLKAIQTIIDGLCPPTKKRI